MYQSTDLAGRGAQAPLAGPLAMLTSRRTYLNILYLLLAFPLGVAYFVFLVTGLSLGVGLAIIWVGLPILFFVFVAWRGLAAFERRLATALLGVEIAPMAPAVAGKPGQATAGPLARLKAELLNPVSWKGLAYLLAKFPLGIASFVAVVTSLSLTGTLLAMPLIYPYGYVLADGRQVDTLSEALLCTILGLFVGLASLYLLNGLAHLSGQFARVMLGSGAARRAAGGRVGPVEQTAHWPF